MNGPAGIKSDKKQTLSPASEARERPRRTPSDGAQAQVVKMQRAAGNQAVSTLLQPNSSSPPPIQAKLVVGTPGDHYEQEADRIAQQVTPGAASSKSRQSPTQRPGLAGETIYRTPTRGRRSPRSRPEALQQQPIDQEAESQIAAMQGQGQSLPAEQRAFFESRLGHDFGEVRVHTDAQAADMAQVLRARAFTVGQDIVFGAGQYAPEGPEGQRLLAHELVHVVQQGAGLNQQPAGQRGDSGPQITAAPAGTIQRDEEKEKSKVPGGEYEFKLEHKGDRWSYSVRFVISKAEPNPLTAKGDVADPGTKTGGVKAALGAAKITRTKEAGKKASNSMALALAKADLTLLEIMPGVQIKADLKALEAKVEKGQVDVNVFKIGVMLEGQLTEAIRGTALGDEIMQTEIGALILEGLKVKVQGRFELSVDPYDAVRLARMLKLNREIAENVEQSVKAKRKFDALTEENKRIRDHLKKRGSKLKPDKRKQLHARMRRNSTKINSLTREIRFNKKAADALRKSYSTIAGGLKTKAGRLVGETVKRVGGKLLLKLVPGVNIVLAIVDIVDVSVAIYKLATGKAKLGFGGGEGEAGTGEGGDAGATGGEAGSAPGGQPGTEAAGGHGTAKDGGATEGGGAAGSEEREFELGPEIDISEELKGGSGSRRAGQGASGMSPPLNPKAKQVYEAIKSATDASQDFGPADIAQLNDIITADLTDEQLKSLIDRIKQQGLPKGDALDALGAILEHLNKVRAPTPVTTVEAEGKREVLPEAPATGEPAQKTKPKGKAKDQTEGDAGAPAKKGAGAGGGRARGKGRGGTAPIAGDVSAEPSRKGGRRNQRKPPSESSQPVLRKIAPIGETEASDIPVTQFTFKILSGYDPTKERVQGEELRLKIAFSRDGQKFEPTFSVVVKERIVTDKEIILHASNKVGWRVEDTNIIMPQGMDITITTSKNRPKKK
jgi:hypothetical protein